MLKKILYLFIILSAFTTIQSCQKAEKKFKVGFLFSDFNAERWEREANYFKERILELGGEAMIAVADGDEVKQYRQAQEFINAGVDVLVITASNANTAAAIVRDAHKKGIKVIAYDGLIRNAELDYLVGFDLEKVGKLQAEYVLKKNPSGNFILFNGDKIHNAALEMNQGINQVLGPEIEKGKIKIIFSGWIENWSGKNASFVTGKIFEFAGVKIDAIIAANDGIAGGVAEELKSRGMAEEYTITGQDGDLPACHRILNGTQTMTVYKSSKLIAYATADLAFKIAKNEKPEGLKYRFNGRLDVPTVLLDPVIVDKSNIESTIIADGIYTMQQIMNFSNTN